MSPTALFGRKLFLVRVATVFGTALLIGCGGGGGGTTTTSSTTTTSTPPAASSCAVTLQAESAEAPGERAPKESTDSRRVRRGRVYQELWKHEASARARISTQAIAPAAVTQDVGQIAVIRDQGDVILPTNPFDLQGAAVQFARNGAGGYDVRRSTRTFQSAVGERVTLGDDASARFALPFTVQFYAERYSELFVNSDGNITFGTDDHESTSRDVARFLTGPPRVAPLFDDLDPSSGGGVFRRIESDAATFTWCSVPEFDALENRVDVQVRIGADGTIDVLYGTRVLATAAVVGVSPGATGIFSPVDVSASAAGTLAGGSSAVGERFAPQVELDFVSLTRNFYRSHGDDFDQLVIFTNTTTVQRGTFAFEFTVANEVTGIGVDVYNTARDFGSGGRLRSIVNMDLLSRYPEDPRARVPRVGENTTLSLLGQECGHRWLAFLQFRDGSTNSDALLGRDRAHWSFFFDSDASHMEGNDIEDRGNGNFRTVGTVSQYSALDQYAMGLRAPADVPPMFVVINPNSTRVPEDPPLTGHDFRGTRRDVRIEDVIAAMGTRRPDTSTSPKSFRQAFVFVAAGAAETSAEIDKLERIRGQWETFFGDSTGGRGTMVSRVR